MGLCSFRIHGETERLLILQKPQKHRFHLRLVIAHEGDLVVFLLQANPEKSEQVVEGKLTVYFGSILLAEMGLKFKVSANSGQPSQAVRSEQVV